MTRESRRHHSTMHPLPPFTVPLLTAHNPKALTMSRAIAFVLAGGLLLAAGARAQTSAIRTEERTEDRTEARTENRNESRSDSATNPQRMGGPMGHHRPGSPGHGHGHGPRHPMMGWMLGRMDTDRDGAISRAELEAEHQRHAALFEQADADHDGKVTADEMRAFHGRHWKERRMEQRREGRPGPAPEVELPARPSEGGEPAR